MRALIAASMLLSASALAQATVNVPQVMGYQGRLVKADGGPVTGPAENPRQVNIIFRIYDQDVGGTLKWTETQKVLLTNGFYAVFLGSQEQFPLGLFDGSMRWLELQIEGDSMPLTPRQQIGSVAYSMTAGTALNVSGGGTVSATGGTFAGPVTVATPTRPEHAATRQYVDGLPARGSTWSAKQTMSGGVTGLPTPTDQRDAATKEYVDAGTFVSAIRCRPDGAVERHKGVDYGAPEKGGPGTYFFRVPGMKHSGIAIANQLGSSGGWTEVVCNDNGIQVFTWNASGATTDRAFVLLILSLQ